MLAVLYIPNILAWRCHDTNEKRTVFCRNKLLQSIQIKCYRLIDSALLVDLAYSSLWYLLHVLSLFPVSSVVPGGSLVVVLKQEKVMTTTEIGETDLLPRQPGIDSTVQQSDIVENERSNSSNGYFKSFCHFGKQQSHRQYIQDRQRTLPLRTSNQ